MSRTNTHKSTRFGRLGKSAAAAALTATAAFALAGSAHATTYSGAYSGSTAPTASTGSTTTPAPTQNLANLSKDAWAASKGVDAAVHFDKGMTTPGASISLAVSFGAAGTYYGTYSYAYGSRFAVKYPAGDGNQRWEVIGITMTEHVNGQNYSYTVGRSVPIRAIWDVTLSALKFTLKDNCDAVGDSEIELSFSHSAAYGTVYFDLSQGQSHYVTEFAKTWNEVGVSADLRVPLVSFFESDWTGARLYDSGGGQTLSDQRLLPGTSHHTSFVEWETSGQCRGQIDYDNYINLHEYIV